MSTARGLIAIHLQVSSEKVKRQKNATAGSDSSPYENQRQEEEGGAEYGHFYFAVKLHLESSIASRTHCSMHTDNLYLGKRVHI